MVDDKMMIADITKAIDYIENNIDSICKHGDPYNMVKPDWVKEKIKQFRSYLKKPEGMPLNLLHSQFSNAGNQGALKIARDLAEAPIGRDQTWGIGLIRFLLNMIDGYKPPRVLLTEDIMDKKIFPRG